MAQADWDIRFLDLAAFVSSWSKDPSTKVGAVIVRPDKTIASVGFNGFPRGLDDRPELYENREEKYSRTVHCELNALLHVREPVHGYGVYVTAMPCDRCTVHLIQAGVRRFVWREPPEDLKTRWAKTFEQTLTYLGEAGVEWSEYPQP